MEVYNPDKDQVMVLRRILRSVLVALPLSIALFVCGTAFVGLMYASIFLRHSSQSGGGEVSWDLRSFLSYLGPKWTGIIFLVLFLGSFAWAFRYFSKSAAHKVS